ncbi:flavin-containing monooxygenase [Parahaliea aestuarii]|uniref:NAD(P)/FAD-dependent oxidoreductase n=1 Tax=Parahaliea aestuarii TaxID=1852021 RepID=A0A5C9A498_9GAMM|nr:NAD(P)/FAD-dependent oxidoreductase [Parahaliea aestuarii]TXS94467.1 NAD(P)/FAD-dependent oxidoreductase [Parahaliea aestuarii]
MLEHLKASVEAITEDDAAIREMLWELNVPSLLMSIVHMSGDTSVLSRYPAPRMMNVVEAGAGGEQLLEGGYTRAQAAQIHEEVLTAIAAYRQRGGSLPELDDNVVSELYTFMCGHELDQRYENFIREEIALDGVDQRGLNLETEALKAAGRNFPVVIIGGGMGGVLAGIRLGEAGIPYTLIEKNSGLGGTWFENHYPGCRVDVPGHSYSYSFEPNHEWSCHFPLADEIRAYFDRCAADYGVKEHTRFNTEVEAARWDEDSATWQVTVVDGNGERDTLTARAVISAVGQLNRPKLPEIDGIDTFNGPLFHSGAWPKGLDLAGKKVAVIGSGASAFQIIPELAETASELTVFQRSPAWMFPNPGYHMAVGDGQKWALKKLPYYSKWYRFWLFYTSIEGVYDKTLVDPAWNDSRSVSAANDEMRQALTAWIESQVQDPALLEKVLPTYPPFGKRILQDNGTYLAALQKDNVELVTEGITAIEPTGVRTADGVLHEVDAIACATGFYADRFLFPMQVTGRDGVSLNEQWGDTNGRAYLGITVPNFPNLFCIYGPNTNLVVAGSIAHNAESQVNYILRSIRFLLEGGHQSMDVRQEVHDSYNDEVDRINADTAWGWEGVNNWYKNEAGRVTANLPFRIIDYWQMTKQPKAEDYRFS